MRAAGRGTSRRIERHVMLFPDPDSPTRPSVSPAATAKETPSTALIVPQRVTRWVRRSRTSMTGAVTTETGRRVRSTDGGADRGRARAARGCLRRQGWRRRIGEEYLERTTPKRELHAHRREQRPAPAPGGHDRDVTRPALAVLPDDRHEPPALRDERARVDAFLEPRPGSSCRRREGADRGERLGLTVDGAMHSASTVGCQTRRQPARRGGVDQLEWDAVGALLGDRAGRL